MKKLLSLMLVMVIAVTVIIALVPSVEAEAAAEYNWLFPVDNGGAIYCVYGYSDRYYNNSKFHTGLDIHAKSGGDDTIYSAIDGVVTWVSNNCTHVNAAREGSASYGKCSHGYGNVICVRTERSDGTTYELVYAHLQYNSILVENGQSVKKGQALATMGSSGNSTGKHLHFQANSGGSTININPNGGLVGYSYSGYGCDCEAEDDFTDAGVCRKCNTPFDWQGTLNTEARGTYRVINTFTPRTDAPYDVANKASYTIKEGDQVTVLASITNAHGSKWYKFLSSNGQTEYVFHSYLKLIAHDQLVITCTGFTPTENESLPLGQGYPVWGTVSSNYPLKKVVAKLDGNEYATWTATDDNTTSFAINPTDINQKLKFGSLSAGKHTITLIATDVHGRTQTFLTRNFNMVSTSCSHSYSSTYSKDENNHWKVCSKCGSTASVETHVYSNSCDTSCNTCGATRDVSHSYEYTWDDVPGGDFNPAPQHYKECTKCGDKKDYENHTWELMRATNGQYMTLQTLHVYECTICGKGKYEDHIYDSACDMDCSVCGRDDRPNVTHSFGTSYFKDESGHWHNCSVCGERDSMESHEYSNNCDITCNTCGYNREATHTYTNACDTSCNICGATRTTSHKYDNACDSSCNVCGATRTANHKYSNACDKSCDVCGATRNVPDHVYDNDCDTSCNSCGYSRSTTHRYSNACDATCNTCGATRSVAHTYTSQYSSNTTSHWRMCTSCGHNGYVENHIPGASATETAPQKCLVCQFVIQEAIGHTHSFENEFEHDDYQHWNKCSDESCGAKTNVDNHNFDNGIVNKEPTTTEKGEITYTCNVCGMKKIEDIDILPDDSNSNDDQPSGEDNPGGSQTPGNDGQGGSQGSGEEDDPKGGIDTTTVVIIAASTAVVAVAGTAIVLKRKPATPKNKATNETKEEQTKDNE